MGNFEPGAGVEMNGNGVVRSGTAIGLLEGAEWVGGVNLRKAHWRGRESGRWAEGSRSPNGGSERAKG